MPITTLEPSSRSIAGPKTFQRIEQDLRSQIASGRLAPGRMLPGRRDLAQTYGVDRGTIQRALASLVADGTLLTDGTRGTFVNPNLPADASTRFKAEAAPRKALSLLRIGIVSVSKPIDSEAGVYGDPWYSRILSGVERVTSGAGTANRYAAVGPYENCYPAISDAVKGILGQEVAGIVLIDIHGPDQSDTVFALAREIETPIVYISAQPASCPVPHVYYDQTAAGFHAANHLIEQGCRSLVFLSPVDAPWLEDRLAGAPQNACRVHASELNVFRDPEITVTSTDRESLMSIGYRAASKILDGSNKLGILAPNDFYALGVLNYARERKLTPGIDFLLIGFDDDDRSRVAGLSTMHPPLENLGAEAARLILQTVSGENANITVQAYSHLVRRASTGG